MTISYFIPGLSSAQAALLDNASCMCTPMQHGNENGYIVAEADLHTALQLLNAQLASKAPSQQYQGLIRVELRANGSQAANARTCGTSSNLGSLTALNTVLAQVQKLQEQANLTEPERVERLRLQAEVQSKQAELEAATQRLKSAAAICDQTSARIHSISEIAKSLGAEMAALPEALQTQCTGVTEHLNGLADKLAELQTSCQNDQTAARLNLSEKKADLVTAKQALSDDIAKHRVSAEDALVGADAALSEADRVSASEE